MMRHRETPEEKTLSPLVQEALAHLQPVPDPDPDSWEQARQAYVAEARVYLADGAVFSSQAGRAAPEARRKERGAGLKTFVLSLGERRPSPMLARLIIVLSIAFAGTLGTLGTVEAAQRSLPGSALYPVKLQIEDLRMARTQDPEVQVERIMEAAEERLEEAERLAERGDTIPAELGERYAEQLSLALQVIDALSGSDRSEVRAKMAEALADHLEAIHELQLSLDDGDASLARMMAAIEQAALELGGLESDLDEGDEVIGDDDDEDLDDDGDWEYFDDNDDEEDLDGDDDEEDLDDGDDEEDLDDGDDEEDLGDDDDEDLDDDDDDGSDDGSDDNGSDDGLDDNGSDDGGDDDGSDDDGDDDGSDDGDGDDGSDDDGDDDGSDDDGDDDGSDDGGDDDGSDDDGHDDGSDDGGDDDGSDDDGDDDGSDDDSDDDGSDDDGDDDGSDDDGDDDGSDDDGDDDGSDGDGDDDGSDDGDDDD